MILKQVDELEPDITSRLALLKAKRTTVQSSGATPWAVVTVDIRTHSFTELGFGPPIKDTSLPVVTLTSVDIGPAQIPTALGSKRTEMVIGTTVEHLPLVWSFAVPLSKGDVDTFRRLTNEYNWCQAALSQDLTPEDQKRVNADLANASSRYAAWLGDNCHGPTYLAVTRARSPSWRCHRQCETTSRQRLSDSTVVGGSSIREGSMLKAGEWMEARSAGQPEPKRPEKPDPFKDYVIDRLRRRCRIGPRPASLLREIRDLRGAPQWH